ncbi:hypothetical protein CHGG_01169 [Chaetomium globosum CBS 148.51]|uniref:Chromo domain-containing protein n=1 Tax=Chaetomium globosum (strain ATCC 6205 / CBS 148.51 / DSM 1962 / NBRC 6347 / NRRL 1970) TaxID=306901 RepID=Q2HF35_CHAGB|nr:uncharacterized protein CHGG_01169 [Chaetomium globosum CBS 148.51]EAQ92934.1 hypothetical protein CHGG_01169 [Chaetomium globosum CBS 148.51]
MAGTPPPTGRKTTIEVPIHAIRKYVPGSGPPPPRIALTPPRDSTGYIIDQFILPTDKDMTTTARRLVHYHVGFTDLPAVKLLIPCHKVLDYVSPRELEDWEYRNLDKKQEQARQLREKQQAAPIKKKPGRPPKIPMEDFGMPLVGSAEETRLLAQQVAGPSLSTPQKRKLGRLLDEEGFEYTSNGESDDAAIARQLDEQYGFRHVGSEDDMVDTESEDPLALHYDAPVAETPPRPGGLTQAVNDSFHVRSKTTPLKTGSSGSSAPAAPPQQDTPKFGGLHPAWAHAFGQRRRSDESPKPHGQDGHAQGSRTPWLPAVQSQTKLTSNTGSGSGMANRHPKDPASRLSTPSAAAYSTIASDSSARKRKEPASNGKKQRKPKKQKVEPQGEPVTDEWEVKDLLDDQWFIEQGVKVHRYLVLWEGDWPEDQNPTWEPAENVQDQTLINRYEKKKAGLLKPQRKAQQTLQQYLAGAKYSSVVEAFEGGINEQTGRAAADIGSDADPSDETFFVTESVGGIANNDTKATGTPIFGSFDSMLARYKQNFG